MYNFKNLLKISPEIYFMVTDLCHLRAVESHPWLICYFCGQKGRCLVGRRGYISNVCYIHAAAAAAEEELILLSFLPSSYSSCTLIKCLMHGVCTESGAKILIPLLGWPWPSCCNQLINRRTNNFALIWCICWRRGQLLVQFVWGTMEEYWWSLSAVVSSKEQLPTNPFRALYWISLACATAAQPSFIIVHLQHRIAFQFVLFSTTPGFKKLEYEIWDNFSLTISVLLQLMD